VRCSVRIFSGDPLATKVIDKSGHVVALCIEGLGGVGGVGRGRLGSNLVEELFSVPTSLFDFSLVSKVGDIGGVGADI
jgi:hypothetical protein